MKRIAKFDEVINARAAREAARKAHAALTADSTDREVNAAIRRVARTEARLDKAIDAIWPNEIDAFAHYSLALKTAARVAAGA